MRIGGWWVVVGEGGRGHVCCEGSDWRNKTGRTDGWTGNGGMDDGGRMDVLMLPTKLYMLL